jgi:hypothetical protein
MINLNQYIDIFEGGASGHMSHVIDETDFTCQDLLNLVDDLFGGKVTSATEKLDGTNIQATMNNQGEVVFIRNKGDLNSEKGGMSVGDMAEKWKDKPQTAKTFVTAGKTLEKIFKRIGGKFFNPDSETRNIVNCECIIAGVTNIMYYDDDQVDFHNIWVYKKKGDEWVKETVTRDGLDTIQKAIEKDDKAKLTPNVIIQVTKDSNKFATEYKKKIFDLFKSEGLGKDATIEDWKKKRFENVAPEWMTEKDVFFNRWFNSDKSVNIRVLKKSYPEHADEITTIDKKDYKKYVKDVVEPIDDLFSDMANKVIELTTGLMNDGVKDKTIANLKSSLEAAQKLVNDKGTEEDKENLKKQLLRFQKLGGKINSTEGVVFTWKGRMMKLTGSFASCNQIIGAQYKIK